jgi:hypothetical protein
MLKETSPNLVIKPISFLSRASRQGRNYSTIVGWLLYTVFKGRVTTLASAIMLNLMHLASQAAAIYALYWYAQQMEQTGIATLPFWHVQFDLRAHPEWLWAVVIIPAGLLVISACLLYLSRRLVLNIAEKYLASSLEQLVLLSLRLPDPRARVASQLMVENGIGGLAFGCRRGALISAAFANALSAFIGGVGAAIVLLRIDGPLTLVILFATIPATLLLYPLTLRAMRSAKDREKVQLAFKQELRQLVQSRTGQKNATSVETVDELARVYLMRRRLITELVFALEIGVTVILGLVVFYMASQALAGREQWAIFIAYVGALRITLSGFSQVIRAFASVSRFYPGIVRYYLFSKNAQRIDAIPLAKVQQGDTIILGTLPNGMEVFATVGQHLALATSDPAPQLQLALLDARLPHSATPAGTTIVDPASGVVGDGVVALLEHYQLDEYGIPPALEKALRDKVNLTIYKNTDKIGSLGEVKLLTVANGALLRFVDLGTNDSESAIKEILRLGAKQQKKVGYLGDDDEEEEDT